MTGMSAQGSNSWPSRDGLYWYRFPDNDPFPIAVEIYQGEQYRIGTPVSFAPGECLGEFWSVPLQAPK